MVTKVVLVLELVWLSSSASSSLGLGLGLGFLSQAIEGRGGSLKRLGAADNWGSIFGVEINLDCFETNRNIVGCCDLFRNKPKHLISNG